jgi:hypothetical protein
MARFLFKTKAWFALILGAVIVVLIFGASWYFSLNASRHSNEEYLPITYVSASYSVDVNNPRELASTTDYIFIGQVVGIAGTEYRWTDGFPYTQYEIDVLANLKGELVLSTIEVEKSGGISQDASFYTLYEGDLMPKPEGVYVFYANAREDGSMLVSGMNSNVLLDIPPAKDKDELLRHVKSTQEYQTIIDALQNPVEPARQHQASKYDAVKVPIAESSPSFGKVWVIGGPAAIDDAVKEEIKALLQG